MLHQNFDYVFIQPFSQASCNGVLPTILDAISTAAQYSWILHCYSRWLSLMSILLLLLFHLHYYCTVDCHMPCKCHLWCWCHLCNANVIVDAIFAVALYWCIAASAWLSLDVSRGCHHVDAIATALLSCHLSFRTMLLHCCTTYDSQCHNGISLPSTW